MERFDVAIVGGGPAGSSCAAFCAMAGLRVLVLEREKFPREKVCGDCLNPSCWSVFERLGVSQRVRDLPHARLDSVEFIAIDGHTVSVELPTNDYYELTLKRSLLDNLLLRRAHELGAEVRDESTVVSLAHNGGWRIETAGHETFSAEVLIGADGRNSTVARLRNLLPKARRERVALQAHIPLPRNFGRRVVLQFLREGYSGQAPVNQSELNLCLVGTPPTMAQLRLWAEHHFEIAADQSWRTITPLTRSPVACAHENLLFVGDAARVVEPFTGEGIYYAMRSGELAATATMRLVRGENRITALREFTRACSDLYRGRLWINRLARAAVLRPDIGSFFVRAARLNASVLKLLTTKIVSPNL
jgi:geranylgeranyl reductase family protein